jgi:hypothetical protein
VEHIALKSCGIVIAEVLPSSCGIAIADSKKSCACPPVKEVHEHHEIKIMSMNVVNMNIMNINITL